MTYDEVLARHERIALQFSGGKDSLAVLFLMRPYLDRLTVYHVDSGDAFPETTELIDKIAKHIPHFVRVQGRKKEVEAELGSCSDIVPCGSTAFGQMMGHEGPMLVDR
jgi:3'-phosphoadenosine 5'-phosphosulfate sulfotransferase (PAPS reductase)/FAD synthetase